MKDNISIIVINQLHSESLHYTAYELESTLDLGFSHLQSWSIESERLDKYDVTCPIRWR